MFNHDAEGVINIYNKTKKHLALHGNEVQGVISPKILYNGNFALLLYRPSGKKSKSLESCKSLQSLWYADIRPQEKFYYGLTGGVFLWIR